MKGKKEFSFMKYLWKYKFTFIIYIISMAIFYLSHVIATIFTAEALAYLTAGDYTNMLWQAGYGVISVVVGRAFGYIGDYCFARLIRDVGNAMRNDLTERMFKITSKSFGAHSAGMFVNRVAYSPDDAIGSVANLIEVLGNIVARIVIVIYITCLNIYIGLVIIFVLLMLFGLEYIKVRTYTKNKFQRKRAHDEIVSFANEVVRSEKDIKSLNLEDKLKSVSDETYGKFKRAYYKEYTTDVNYWTARSFILEIFSFCLILFSLYLFEGGHLALSAFLYIFVNRSSFSDVIWSAGRVISQVANIRLENFRMKEIFDENTFAIEKFGDVSIENSKLKGKVAFKRVCFGYEDINSDLMRPSRAIFVDRKKYKKFLNEREKLKKLRAEGKIKKNEVIKDMSFTIPAGKTVAFVGRSGSGKSTILSLIPKLYEVDKGQVLIDGVDVKLLTKETLRRNISLVNQFPYIFNASIKENLLMANKDATEEMIEDALRKASLLDFVKSLTNGVETVVGENGIKLSGGQRQRLAIARALLKESKIIIFDESTSSLDNFAQEEVRKSIEALKGKTVVIVAHRLSTIRHADIIFFLDKGKIIAKGKFNELFENNEQFRDMFVAENIS